MPNLKLYIDETRYDQARADIAALLPQLRQILCEGLAVTPAACQLAAIPVMALPDQPGINAELHIMPGPSRTRDRLEEIGARLRDALAGRCNMQVAIRIAQLDPATYVALK